MKNSISKLIFVFALCFTIAVVATQAQKLELVVQTGHSTRPYNIAFCPDGKLFASASAAEIILWDITNHKQLRLLQAGDHGPNGSIDSITFRPDGKILASANYDSTIKLWNVTTGELIRTLKGHSGSVWGIAFSPENKILATGSADKTVKLWNLETGEAIKTLIGHTEMVASVAFHPEGKILASSSSDDTIRIWNLETGKLLKLISGTSRKGNIGISIAFSPNGKLLVSNYVGSIKFINTETWNEINVLEKEKTNWWVHDFALSPNEEIIATVDNQEITLWNLQNGKFLKTITTKSSQLEPITFSPNGKILASIDENDNIRFWNVENALPLEPFIRNSSLNMYTVFSSSEQILASGREDGTTKIWDIKTGQISRTLRGHADTVGFISISPDGRTLATHSVASGRNLTSTVKFWDIATGKEIRTLNFESWVLGLFSPDGRTFLIVSNNPDNKEDKFWSVNLSDFKMSEVKALPEWLKLDRNFFEQYTKKQSTIVVNNISIRSIPNEAKVKFINSDTKQEAASLISLNENDWAVIAPDGRFDASEGALKLMYYTYGLEIINLEQLKEMYYEPGLLQKLLGFNKEPLRPIIPLKDVKLYPEIVEQKFEPTTGKLNIKLKNRGGGIGKTEVYLNGKRVVEDARSEKLKQNPIGLNEEIINLTVDLPVADFIKGIENQIKVVTSNFLKEIGKGNIQSRGNETVYLNGDKRELQLPTLYAIVGGVSNYEGNGIDLRFAAKDTEDFSAALQLGAKRLFGVDKVHMTTLSTLRAKREEQPTKENFKKAFAEIAQKAKPEDILVVYLSGHGVTLGTGTDTYFYLTKEARSTIKTDLETNFQTVAISNAELIDWLTPNKNNPNDIFIKTLKQVIILDTCSAGNFVKEDEWKKDREGLTGDQIRAMEFLKDKAGTFILMGSAANRPSYEANPYNQGLLTYALLEGMQGRALQDAFGNVDVQTLFSHTEKRVPQLAKEINLEQRPIIKQPSGNTFLIGQMTDEEKKSINLPLPKPLLLRPVLGVAPINNDPLKLIPELRKRLDAESSYEVLQRSGKGAPLLIYIDDDSFPGAWRVTGQYKIEDSKVTIEAFLVSDAQTIALKKITSEKEKVLDELINVLRDEISKIKVN